MRRKLCHCCRKLYQPHPQTYRQQKTCDKESCRAWRKSQAVKAWKLKYPKYAQSDPAEQELWRKAHPNYWKTWRESHPAYVARNQKAQRVRDAKKRGFLAKGNAWRPIWLQNLDQLRQIRNLRNLAKRNEWTEVPLLQIDGICRYLKGQVSLVKGNAIDLKQ